MFRLRSDKTLVEAIRAAGALVVPVINLDTTSGPTDAGCALASLGTPPEHWQLATRTATVGVVVPEDLGVAEVFEVTLTGTADVTFPVTTAGRTVTLGGVPLSNAVPVRLYVLASDKGLRAKVAAAMAY